MTILLCYACLFVLFWFVLCQVLVSLDCSFLIAPSIFSNVYFIAGCIHLTCVLIYFTACSNHQVFRAWIIKYTVIISGKKYELKNNKIIMLAIMMLILTTLLGDCCLTSNEQYFDLYSWCEQVSKQYIV